DHLRHFALVDVRIGELQLPVFRHLAVVDVDAQVGSVAADQPHAVGNGIEVDRGPAADRQHDLELRFQGGFAGRGVDRVDAAVGAHSIEHAVGRTHVDAEHLADTLNLPGLHDLLGIGFDDGYRVVAPERGNLRGLRGCGVE